MLRMPAILIRPLRQIRQVCRSVMLFSTFLLITLFCADEANEAGVSAELLAWYKARDGSALGSIVNGWFPIAFGQVSPLETTRSPLCSSVRRLAQLCFCGSRAIGSGCVLVLH